MNTKDDIDVKGLKDLKDLKDPKERVAGFGFMAFEWVILAYLLVTLAVIIILHDRMVNPSLMIWGRVGIFAFMCVMWGAYRVKPCLANKVVRVVFHLVMLSWWYPDTFELNRLLPNLDHVFASLEQSVFGMQPALLFSKTFDSPIFSELMCLGYGSYFPMIAVVSIYYLIRRRVEFERIVFVIIAAFFIHYVIFDLLPVSGPQFYYYVVGEDQIAQGMFPNIHDYYYTSWDGNAMPIPGDKGPFQMVVQMAHETGERPTAAFPSSHVGITTVLLLIAWHSRSKWLFFCLLPLGILMFFATFYIKAHYAIDAFAGLVSGALCYWFLMKIKKAKFAQLTQ